MAAFVVELLLKSRATAHMFVLPNGRVLASSTTEHPIMSQVLDINAQTWSVVDPDPVDGGSAAMYLPGKIVKAGTSYHPDDPIVPSAATTYVIDMTQPSPRWRQTPPMAFARTYHTLTILPDGDVLVTGGGTTTNAVGVSQAVMPAEIWSPDTETWTVVASMSAPRLYHSTALLMPDARVLVLGGGRFNGVNEPTDQLNAQYYSPPYLFSGPRSPRHLRQLHMAARSPSRRPMRHGSRPCPSSGWVL